MRRKDGCGGCIRGWMDVEAVRGGMMEVKGE
jgi:hypothetical protein